MRNLKTLFFCSLLAVLLVLCISRLQDVIDRQRKEELSQSIITGDIIEKASPLLLAGFRGVVVDILWIRAERLKQEEEWYELPELYTYITKLQPNLPSVWEFISWNDAWNIAHEWKAYEDKWKWIKKGIDDAYDGVIRNPESAKLLFWLAYIHAQRFDLKIFREEGEWLEVKYREEHGEIIEQLISKLNAMPEQERGTRGLQDFRNLLEKIRGPEKSNLEVSIACIEDAVRLKENELWEEFSRPGKLVLRVRVGDVQPFVKDTGIAKKIAGGAFVFVSLDFGLLADKVERKGGMVKVKGAPNAKVNVDIRGKKVQVDVESITRWLERRIREKSAVWARAGCRWRDHLVGQLEREADRLAKQMEGEVDNKTRQELTALYERKLKEAQKRAEEAVKKWKYHKENWPDEVNVVSRAFQEATVKNMEIKERLKELNGE